MSLRPKLAPVSSWAALIFKRHLPKFMNLLGKEFYGLSNVVILCTIACRILPTFQAPPVKCHMKKKAV